MERKDIRPDWKRDGFGGTCVDRPEAEQASSSENPNNSSSPEKPDKSGKQEKGK